MKKTLTILCVFLLSHYYAQLTCTPSGEGPTNNLNQQPPPSSPYCTYNSNAFINKYQKQEFWIPEIQGKTKTLKYQLHIIQMDDGTGNWTDVQFTHDKFAQINEWLNGFYSNVDEHYMDVPGAGYLENSQIQFELMDIFFYQNTDLYTNTNTAQLENFIATNYPERDDYFHVFVNGGYYLGAQGYAFFPSYGDINSGSRSIWTTINNPNNGYYAAAQHLAHEFGHTLDLRHMYNHEHCVVTHQDFLDDVFIPNYPGVPPASGCDIEYYIGNCDLTIPDQYCTNNIMSGKGLVEYAISPLQMGRIHRVAHLKETREFIWGYSDIPLVIDQNETWDFSMKMYENLVIKSGNTLTVTCEIQFVPEAKLIVEPGAKLILDGGTLTNASRSKSTWEGIEVWGNSDLSQSWANQGVVITRNNAVIENAKTAIRLIAKDENGEFDWGKTGGLIYAYNTHFKNNNRSAEFLHYHNFTGTNSNFEIANKSLFRNCDFTWDNDYLGETPEPAITMYHVNGVIVKGCNFEDLRDDFSDPSRRAKGIFTLDAGYRVLANSPLLSTAVHDEYSTDDGYVVNTFKNMKWGVNATNANTQYAVNVDHTLFENVANPVILSCVNNSVITRNMVDMTADRHPEISESTGIWIENSTGYTVEGNTSQSSDPGTYVFGSIAIETGSDQNQIYRNYGLDNYIGQVSLGRNSNTNAFNYTEIDEQSGLVWKCNVGDNNRYDLFSETSGSTEDGRGVRAFQGTNNESAGNVFTDAGSSALVSNIVNTDDQQMSYFYFNGNPGENPGIVQNVAKVSIDDEAICNSNFGTIITVKPNLPLIRSGKKILLEERKAQLRVEIDELKTTLNDRIEASNPSSLYTEVRNISRRTAPRVFRTLYDNSPYLSDSLLREVGNISPDLFPHSWMGTLVLRNIEVAQNESFFRFLQTKEAPLRDPWMSEIAEKRGKEFTERGDLEMDILDKKSERAVIQNQLLANTVSDSIVDWETAKSQIIERNNILMNVELLELALMRKNAKECQDKLELIEKELDLFNGLPSVRKELEGYVALKKFLVSRMDERGIYREISDDDLPILLDFSSSLTGIAQQQAKNLLCFHRGICEDKYLPVGTNTMMMVRNTAEETSIVPTIDAVQLRVVPNPNNGIFELSLSDAVEIESIEMVGLDGNSVPFTELQRAGSTMLIELNNKVNSVILVQVTGKDGAVYTERIVVHN